MCGILGWLGPGFDATVASKMCDRLRHRGPDGRGEWREERDGGVWLAHRRLAILDLSEHGHQPMHSPCGRYVLTFNGEVYNFQALRRELQTQGTDFRGHSDSEVVLVACAKWGVEVAVRRFEGMFALGLYDRLEGALWLVRDPMGIKPLYYAHQGDCMAFASELTPLRDIPWVDQSIDTAGLFAYFRYGCLPAPVSIIKGVRKLESGSLLRFQNGKLTIKPYWSLHERASEARFGQQKFGSLNEAADELETLLRKSVRQHMQADVPYGAFLSGGIDSSTVVALMQAESDRPIKTFSIGFEEASHDESAHARAVASHIGTDHHEMILNADAIPALVPTVANFYDEPFADNSSIPTYLVSRFARESVKVCLSGDGGDELFGGYPRYFWASRIERMRRRLGVRGARFAGQLLQTVPVAFWDNLINRALGYRYTGSEGLAYRVRRYASYLASTRSTAYAQTMSIWGDPAELMGFSPEVSVGADASHYPELSWSEEMMLIDQGNFLQDDILTKVDRASMAVSLEARVPLLTHPLVEFSWRLDPAFKLDTRGDRGKLILRNVLCRHVPPELIDRPKQGFGMPVGVWLRGGLRDWAESLLEESALENSGLNARAVRSMWHEHQAGADRQAMLWAVLMYQQWEQRRD